MEFLVGTKDGLLNAGTPEEGTLDDCEPCCLEDLTITFVDPGDATLALHQLAVFIRLWRTCQAVPNASYSFAELRDICDILDLFVGGNAELRLRPTAGRIPDASRRSRPAAER